ncbi:fimbrillin family protein [Bacteroides xylanisolvens]|uniref:fimbrillin family protein n=1 Tax=Bacteroides xylanisolvens TaxID=371601 RepID=UPI00189F3890|nr:fimbrillin family protein [Bacteroides xylanisolvens]
MKKRHSIQMLLTAAALLLVTAACTKDELADGDRLPEGQYPLEIARITLGVEGGEAQPWGAPATRVSENGDGTGSVFSAGDRFAVQINAEEGIYIVQDDGSIKAESPLYWSDSGEHTVTAWYPATDGTLDLSDQSQSLAYLLGGSGTGDYQTPVTLTFAHRLAKVRVTPTGDALGEVQSLQLYTYTQCTYEKGTVVQGSQEGWIEMKRCEYTENGVSFTCWEANVVPDYEITKLMANNDNKERDLSSAITPEAGSYYNITLDKDKGYTEVSEGNYTVDNEKGLRNLAKLVNSNGGKTPINITLTGDITLTEEWTPIGNFENRYTGTFDGGGHTITGLTVNQKERGNVGLIGYLGSGGKVQNLTLENVNLNGNLYVGGVVGYSNNGTVTACTASGSINGKEYVGGIVGSNYLGTVTACYNTSSTVNGSYLVGGVVGQNNKGIVTACYNASGSIYGEGTVGGVVGDNYTSTVTACYWSNYAGYGIGNGTGDATKVDGTTVIWQTAIDAMNAALQNAGSEWRYELTGELPTLKK